MMAAPCINVMMTLKKLPTIDFLSMKRTQRHSLLITRKKEKGDLIPINGDQDMALVTKEIMQKLGHEA